MSKQTAIEWLMNRFISASVDSETDIMTIEVDYLDLELARKMEREEVEAVYNAGFDDGQDDANGDGAFYESGQDYYNKTYGGEQ